MVTAMALWYALYKESLMIDLLKKDACMFLGAWLQFSRVWSNMPWNVGTKLLPHPGTKLNLYWTFCVFWWVANKLKDKKNKKNKVDWDNYTYNKGKYLCTQGTLKARPQILIKGSIIWLTCIQSEMSSLAQINEGRVLTDAYFSSIQCIYY